MSLETISPVEAVTTTANICLMFSVAILAYQVWLQRRELRYSVYEKLMSDFSNASLVPCKDPDLREMYVGESRPAHWSSYSAGDKAMYFYFDSLLGLFERVWVSYKEDKWVGSEDWEQWRNWIGELVENRIFQDLIKESEKLYDPLFLKEINRIASKK